MEHGIYCISMRSCTDVFPSSGIGIGFHYAVSHLVNVMVRRQTNTGGEIYGTAIAYLINNNIVYLIFCPLSVRDICDKSKWRVWCRFHSCDVD